MGPHEPAELETAGAASGERARPPGEGVGHGHSGLGSSLGTLAVAGDGETWKAIAARFTEPKRLAELVGPIAARFGATLTVDVHG